MDKLSVQLKSPKHLIGKLSNKRSKKKEPVKIVYISNPLRVTLSASEFKDRVQELTGQDSDVADYMLEKVVETTTTATATATMMVEEEEEEEQEQGLTPTPPMASVDLQWSTSTASSSGVSDPYKDSSVGGGSMVDLFDEVVDVFSPQYAMGAFTDLYNEDSFRHFGFA